MDIKQQLIEEFGLKKQQIDSTIELFDEGATVPFVARYRKERTGGLDEIQLRDILHKYSYYKELDERKSVVLESISAQGKLTDDLKKKIENTLSKTVLEDLYLPFRPKRTTRGTKARDAGLEPFANWLIDCSDLNENVDAKANEFLNPEKGFDNSDKTIKGACDILAERLSDDADVRKWLRDLAYQKGQMVTVVRKDFANQKTKFSMYYDYKENVKSIPSHRVLAMFRGEKEKILRVELLVPEDEAMAYLSKKLIVNDKSATTQYLEATVKDAFNRLLISATETEIRKELRQSAEEEAFKVFGDNLRALLLAPPAGQRAVLGIDPGFRTGCKVVAIDNTGKLMEFKAIYPNAPQNKIEESSSIVLEFINKYEIELIAIGNGTASRETQSFINECLKTLPKDKRPESIIVSESGASVYSASEIAIKEFPDHDITVRGAVSIARRLQDPLSELVKIDPKAIGVGQYQHDVNQTKLKNALEEVVESCVNNVGVDVNLASLELLKYVSGCNRTIAKKIVDFRNKNGAFTSRKSLMNVDGLGAKTFEQSAGFLKITGGENPLDNSSVHPESYSLVEEMAKSLNLTVSEIIGSPKNVRKIDKNKFISDKFGLLTIEDILAELEKPNRDPRDEFKYAKFDEKIQEISDLREGLKLEGTVTNVTNFGAFVDIGVHQDGLVHISQLSDKFVDDPKKVIKVGQVVKVTVLEIDEDLKRISLSMKSNVGNDVNNNNANIQNKKHINSTNKSKHFKKTVSGRDKNGKLITAKPKFNIKQFM